MTDKNEYTFTDEKGNKITYRLNLAKNRDYPEPYNRTLAISVSPVADPNGSFESGGHDKVSKDAKDYFAAHPEFKIAGNEVEILTEYLHIQAQNHICDKVLNGTANSWEQAFAQGLCTQPAFLRPQKVLNLGTSIMVSEDIADGKEPFVNAVKNEEKKTGKKVSPNVDGWITYSRKAELLKYVESQYTKAEIREQQGEITTNPKAQAQGYRIDKKYTRTQEQGHEPEINAENKALTSEKLNAMVKELMAKKSRE